MLNNKEIYWYQYSGLYKDSVSSQKRVNFTYHGSLIFKEQLSVTLINTNKIQFK